MRHFVIRILLCPLLLWAIYTITFLMVVMVPGNPFAQDDRATNQAVVDTIMAEYHADDNWEYYKFYLSNLFNPIDAIKQSGPLINLGPSWEYTEWSCNQIIFASLPISMTLGFSAISLAVFLGIPIGVISAVKKNSWFDYASLSIALIGISLPTFVTGSTLLICCSVFWLFFPVEGWGTVGHLVLPAITLSLPFMAYIARLTRLGMLDVLSADYIRTAQSKGLPPRRVIWTHAFKNAFLPVLSYLGPAIAQALTGSFVIEKIFNIPGLGQHFINGVINRDRGIIMATALVFSSVIIFFNILIDMAYHLVDPRITVDK